MDQYKLIEAKYVDKETVKKEIRCINTALYICCQCFVEMVRQFGMEEYEFAIRETKTYEVIEDVKNFKSEIGILYLNDFNQKILHKLFSEYGLEFHPILDCHIYVYMWKGHPLADKEELTLEELEDYPCLALNRAIIILFILQKKY